MKHILFTFFCMLTMATSRAQNRVENVDVGPEFKKLISEFNQCAQSSSANCISLINEIIEKGMEQKVPFLDYLYYEKSYYYMMKEELDSAIAYSQLSLSHPHPVEIQRSDLDAYNILANCYYYKGNLNLAIQTNLKVAKILENGGSKLHLGYLYSNIATLLGETGNNSKQKEYLFKSYQLLKENKDQKFIGTVASNLALGYYFTRDTIKADEWAKNALALSIPANDLVAKTQATFVLSLIQTDLTKALSYAEQSVKYADESGDKIQMGAAYYRYAEVLSKMSENKKALNYAEQAVKLAKEVGDNVTLPKASYTAANIYFNLGLKEKSADYYHTYAIYKDSISSAENARVINDINTKYETEKKEKKIAEQELKIQKQQSNLLYAILGGAFLASVLGSIFLYHRNAQKLKLKQLQQEKENAILNSFILGEERERNRISHELHDGVAAMIGAAKMSLEAIPHLPEEKRMEQLSKVRGILEHSHADIRHIAHNLLPTVLEKEGLIKATAQFVSEVNDTKLVNITIRDKNSNANEYSKQLQLMLFRVIQELVNNIIKHSQAENAEIVFSKLQSGLLIEITDDGIGYDDTKGKENQGLYSITQRLKSIGGNFIISKENQGGTRAKVELTV